MKKVIVFREEILCRSETFIREQLLALTQWEPVLAGYCIAKDGLDLGDIDVRLLPGLTVGKWQRRRLRLCQWLGIAHMPTVRRLRDIGANLVHAHFGTDAVDVWPSVRKLGLPMLVSLHGYDINTHREWWEAGHGGARRKRYPRQLLRLSRESMVNFVAVSEIMRTRAIEYGIAADKIAVRYVGVDTQRFSPGPMPIRQRTKRILFVGRLVEKKGVEYLIRAFACLRNDVPEAELVVVGDGPMRRDLESLAGSLAVPVNFLGATTSEHVIEQMHQARAFCLPSVTAENGDAEGFGLVLLEAQACGIPVVSSAFGGATEGIIEGCTGFRVAEKSVEELSEKLRKLLMDDDLCSLLSINAVAFTGRKFGLKSCAAEMEQSYDFATRFLLRTNETP